MNFEKITVVATKTKEVEVNGETRTKYMVKTKEHGDKVLTTFSRNAQYYKEGSEEYVVITANGEYLNFKPVTVRDLAATLYKMNASGGATSPAKDEPEEDVDSIDGW